jgi:hypothetical protein
MTIYELLVLMFSEQPVASVMVSVVAIIGAATALVNAAEYIAGITPSTKDDEYVSEFKRKLGVLVAFLDKVAMSKRGE